MGKSRNVGKIQALKIYFCPMNPPVFSIITVVFNGKNLLEGTARSVQNQTYPHIEYLIVDGASTDGTLDLIQKFAAEMPNLRWISERDKGLYDAMNKGLQLATGDFVWFLNCGDHLHSLETVEKMVEKMEATTDVFFGETLLVDDSRRPAGTMSELSTRKMPARLRWQDYLGGMLVVHQSFVPRRSLAPDYLLGNLCADFDWCIQILKKSRRNTPTETILTDYLMGGMSKQRHRQSLLDRFWVMRRHFGLFQTLLAHGWILGRAVWHRVARLGRSRY